jgi:hypothetical protein
VGHYHPTSQFTGSLYVSSMHSIRTQTLHEHYCIPFILISLSSKVVLNEREALFRSVRFKTRELRIAS